MKNIAKSIEVMCLIPSSNVSIISNDKNFPVPLINIIYKVQKAFGFSNVVSTGLILSIIFIFGPVYHFVLKYLHQIMCPNVHLFLIFRSIRRRKDCKLDKNNLFCFWISKKKYIRNIEYRMLLVQNDILDYLFYSHLNSASSSASISMYLMVCSPNAILLLFFLLLIIVRFFHTDSKYSHSSSLSIFKIQSMCFENVFWIENLKKDLKRYKVGIVPVLFLFQKSQQNDFLLLGYYFRWWTFNFNFLRKLDGPRRSSHNDISLQRIFRMVELSKIIKKNKKKNSIYHTLVTFCNSA